MTLRLLTILILTIPTLTIGQEKNDERKTFVFESNLPTELRDLYEQKIKPAYAIRTDLNPFYLKGDFDGDKIQDYAISVVEKKSDKKGILIYHSGTKTNFLLGAGKQFNERHPGDDFWWMDAWTVTRTGPKSKSKGESILVIKTESSSGLIYWTGIEYKWQQEGD